jgi:hypothetical protein
MRDGGLTRRGLMALALAALPLPAQADPAQIEDFTLQPETRWQFFTDGVMGGVSTGQVTFLREGGVAHARMTGRVSTANRGGFIQMRLDLSSPPTGMTGVRLVARGNEQRYFVHLRITGTVLPWQYSQAGFDVTRRWSEMRLPFDTFRPSGALLRATPRPDRLTSIAIAAFGRDHEAEVDIREIGFY